MFRNYLKVALRNMWNNKLFTGLNILGLTMGLASSILIFLWVQDELSYDKFIPGADRIFRLTGRTKDIESAQVPMALAGALKNDIPGVRNATRVVPDAKIMQVGTDKFDEKLLYDVDSNFFKVFNYPLLIGNAPAALRASNNVILTRSTAIKYFGSPETAVGRSIFDVNDSLPLQVAGVMEDIPANSHLRFGMLLSMQTLPGQAASAADWRHFDSYVYFQLEGTGGLAANTPQHIAGQLTEIRNKAIANTKAVAAEISVQPLTSIHLHSHFRGDVEGQGNAEYVRIFILAGIFILVIACINFMNLATAMSSARSKEVGLRKTIGALRSQLTLQFIGESLVLAFISLLLSLLLACLALPYFNSLASKSLSLNLLDIALVGKLLVITLIVGLLAGSYPAFYISSFNVVKVLKDGLGKKGGSAFLRDATVVFQFSVAIILMISTVVVYDQLGFLHSRDIGFDRQNLLYAPLPDLGNRIYNTNALRSSLGSTPQVEDYTIVSDLPTNLTTGRQLTWRGMEPGMTVISQWMGVDDNFLKAFDIKMAAGRFYSGEFKGGDSEYVVNETALRIMHMNVGDAIGKMITLDGKEGTIMGVVKDFNFKPAYQPLEPLVLRRRTVGGVLVSRTPDYAGKQSIAAIRECFHHVYGNAPFSYGFVDQDLDHLYAAEVRMGSLFRIFSVLAIAISCLGLFGLATFTTQKRTKEIGVRKVLGAGETRIVFLLAKEFLVLVGISVLIAFPISWYAMNQWLQGFAYKAGISGWVFVAAGVLAILIACATVSYHTIKAALANPVRSLQGGQKR